MVRQTFEDLPEKIEKPPMILRQGGRHSHKSWTEPSVVQGLNQNAARLQPHCKVVRIIGSEIGHEKIGF
jgi:hypothetical protein